MEKIKGFLTSDYGKDIMVIIIVILVGISSFCLGRLSVGTQSSGVKIEYPLSGIPSQAAAVVSIPGTQRTTNNNGTLV